MRTNSSKIKILSTLEIKSVRRTILFDRTHYFKFIKNIKFFVLGKLLGVQEGYFYIVKTNHQYAVRSLLDSLKEKKFIEGYGEGVLFSDYPKFYFVGIVSFLKKMDTAEKHYSWGYVLPGDDKEKAYSKALGETLERHATYYSSLERNVAYPKFYKGDASFLYPFIPKFTQEQIKKYSDIVTSEDDMKEMFGFKVKSITGGTKQFLPVESFYWGGLSDKGQKVFFHPTTSGSGGGITHDEALLSAIYEGIERDHFLLYWFSGISPNQIQLGSADGGFGEYIEHIKKDYNLEVYFLDTRYDTEVLSTVCVLIDPVLNLIAMGGKAGLQVEEVLRGSFLEALAILCSIRDRGEHVSESELRTILGDFSLKMNLGKTKRMNLYSSPHGISLVKSHFLDGGHVTVREFSGSVKRFDTKKEEKEYLLAMLQRLVTKKGDGYHAYVHDFSSIWTKETDYFVTHVFIPSFLKLHLIEALATPVSERVYAFAKEKEKSLHSEKDINRLPHFFS